MVGSAVFVAVWAFETSSEHNGVAQCCNAKKTKQKTLIVLYKQNLIVFNKQNQLQQVFYVTYYFSHVHNVHYKLTHTRACTVSWGVCLTAVVRKWMALVERNILVADKVLVIRPAISSCCQRRNVTDSMREMEINTRVLKWAVGTVSKRVHI